jgi:hypothetical protein
MARDLAAKKLSPRIKTLYERLNMCYGALRNHSYRSRQAGATRLIVHKVAILVCAAEMCYGMKELPDFIVYNCWMTFVLIM